MKNILWLFFLGSFSLSLLAQETQQPYRQYATQQVHQRLLKENPNMSKELLKIERKISKNHKIENHLKDGYIPLYFHVLYNKEEERINESQVLSQIEVLNEDFALSIQPDQIDIQSPFGYKNNGKTKQYEIQLSNEVRPLLDIKFCLAKSNGNASSINYVSTKTKEWGTDNAIKFKKSDGADIKQPNKYLNVWIGNLTDSVSGYAQMPGGPDKTDGIVIDYRFFGVGGTAQAPYDLGRTLTHLVGNYLGLHDIWNETNSCGDDFVEDTPIHNAPNFGCPQYIHISTCFDLEPEMTMNFMDNTDDACQSLFTVGQMKRMYQMLAPSGPRNSVLSGETQCDEIDNLSPTAVPRLNSTPSKPQVQLSPNPAQQVTKLEIMNEAEAKGQVHIYSTIGKLVYSKPLDLSKGYNNLLIQTGQWQTGIYFLHLQINEHKVVKILSVIHTP